MRTPTGATPLVHLGLGNFFRSHQAWYTDCCAGEDERDRWGYAAFAGRRGALVEALRAQGGRYTLICRGPEHDELRVVRALRRPYHADDHQAWLHSFRAPELAVVTVTVTEAGYGTDADGALDLSRPDVAADVVRLRSDPTAAAHSVAGRLAAGLAARWKAGGGPVALVPCDNMAHNDLVLRQAVGTLCEHVDHDLAAWVAASTTVVGTVVDRITPHAGFADTDAVGRGTQWRDRCPVVAEPYAQWVLQGAFPAGRPRWEDAGAVFVDDVTPYADRKLWMLNGAHSLLAYAGSIWGHRTLPDAAEDSRCRTWVESWWDVAADHLGQDDGAIASYRAELWDRFGNRRLSDTLARVAADGSQKLPVRVLPVLRAERAAGRLAEGATRVLAAWLCHLRGAGAPVDDVRAGDVVPLAVGPLRPAARRVLGWLDPALGEDTRVVDAVVAQCDELRRDLPGAGEA